MDATQRIAAALERIADVIERDGFRPAKAAERSPLPPLHPAVLSDSEIIATQMEKAQQVQRVCAWVLEKLRIAGADGCGIFQADLSRAIAGRDRRCLNEVVIPQLVDAGVIRRGIVDGKTIVQLSVVSAAG